MREVAPRPFARTPGRSLQSARGAGAIALAATLALSGCSGGSVAVHSGFPPPPAPPAGSAGLSVSGSSGLALGIVLALIVADGIYWVVNRGEQGPEGASAAAPRPPLWQPIDRGWVDRGP